MADTLVLGTSASACGFESHRPHLPEMAFHSNEGVDYLKNLEDTDLR